jgi:hypothetical protein
MADPVRVFVSHHHSSEEDAFTARLVEDLQQAGARVWVDVAEIRDGDFMERINGALVSSEWVVLVLTPAALRSQPVRTEINAAHNLVWQGRLRGVIPFMAKPTDPGEIPPTWGTLQRYDATRDYPSALANLLRTLGLGDQAEQWRAALSEMRERLTVIITELQRITSDASESNDLAPLIEVVGRAAKNPRHVDYMTRLWHFLRE